jgi:hypothetical protein
MSFYSPVFGLSGIYFSEIVPYSYNHILVPFIAEVYNPFPYQVRQRHV